MALERFVVLDSFRGIAAIFVMIFHIHSVSGISEWVFFRNSAVFVEFFFLLSGFVIAHAYGRRLVGVLSVKRYMISRVRRLFPLHLFMLCVFLVFECAKFVIGKYLGLEFNGLPFSGATDLRELIPNALLLQSWLPGFDMLSFNGPAWSISVEFYVYILFAVVVLCAGCGSVPSLVLFFVFYSSPWVFTELPRGVMHGIACFFAGVAVRHIYPAVRVNLEKWMYRSYATVIELLVLSLVCFAVVQFGGGVICVVLFSLVILLFSIEGGGVSKILAGRYFRFLGERSYSIYLAHSAVIFVFLSVLMVFGKVTGDEFLVMSEGKRNVDLGFWGNTSYMLLVVSATVAFSSYTYRFVEKRFISVRR